MREIHEKDHLGCWDSNGKARNVRRRKPIEDLILVNSYFNKVEGVRIVVGAHTTTRERGGGPWSESEILGELGLSDGGSK